MHLAELCEPLFNYMCRLNRLSCAGQVPPFDSVRSQVKELFATMTERAKCTPALAAQYGKVELPLFFFVDSCIAESPLPFASLWHQRRLAYERNELAGDESFFDLLDEAMALDGPEVEERLLIFYTCIGLGFTGWYQSQPEYLRKKMRQLADRLGVTGPAEDKGLVTPEAYEHTDTSNLPLPMAQSLAPLMVVLLGLLVLVGGINYHLFERTSRDLQQSLETILTQAGATGGRGASISP